MEYKILVPLSPEKANHPHASASYHTMESYLTRLGQVQLMPLFVAPGMSQAALDELYAQSHGLFLIGGEDFYPSLYGQEAHAKTKPADLPCDELWLALTRRALADRLPILAICRGCQALAIASGGTLHQHVADQFPSETHSLPDGADYGELVTNPKHPMRVTADSTIHRILNRNEVLVNTGHHQAVATVGPDLVMSGTSPAGVVECIEHHDQSYFCIGIQSHPEVADPELDPVSIPLFATFAAAVAAHASK